MVKLKVLSGKAVCRILASQGFVEVRRRSSHMVMQKITTDGSTVTVPVPDHKELRTGTLMSIIRQSELPRALFE